MVLLYGRVLCELGKSPSKDGVFPDAVTIGWSKLRTPRPMRLCARGSGEDVCEPLGAVVLEKASLLRHHKLLRAGRRHVVNDKRRWGPLRKTGGWLPKQHHLLR